MKCLLHTSTVMELTTWKPPLGMDPKLRQFECPKCHRLSYKRPTPFEDAQKPHPQTAK